MRAVWIFFIFAFAFSSCQKEVEPVPCEGEIKIRFYNLAESMITDVSIDGVEVGVIRTGESTYYQCFDEFGTDTGWPDCRMTGTYQGKKLGSTSQFYWCGTEKSSLKPGIYEIEIKVVEWGSETYFDLQFVR